MSTVLLKRVSAVRFCPGAPESTGVDQSETSQPRRKAVLTILSVFLGPALYRPASAGATW
jgi:hypothetical protein